MQYSTVIPLLGAVIEIPNARAPFLSSTQPMVVQPEGSVGATLPFCLLSIDLQHERGKQANAARPKAKIILDDVPYSMAVWGRVTHSQSGEGGRAFDKSTNQGIKLQ